MAEPFRDFFQELPHCLKAGRSREENYQKLRERQAKVINQHSQAAKLEQAQINQAMPIFQDEQRYRAWRKQFDAGQRRGSAKEGGNDEARRKAEAAQERARKAEQEHLRAAQKAEELQRKLEEAEREKEAAAKASQLPLWARIGLQGLDLLLKSKSASANPSAWAPPMLESAPIDLTGQWKGGDGITYHIWQNGEQVGMQGKNFFGIVVSQGEGTFDGRQIRFRFQTGPIITPLGFIPTVGEMWGEVSADGRVIQGEGINQTLGSPFQIALRRR